MKKLFLLSALFAVGLALTSCADRTEEVRGEYTGLLDRFDQKGEAYMSLLISTPTESGTRADEKGNDNFDPGTEAENAVSSALLFLFVEETDGNNVTTTKLQGVYDMAVGATSDGTGTVAKQCTAVISSNGVSNTATLKAYVACNYGQVFTALDASKHTVKLVKDNKEIALGTTWEDFQKYEAESIGIITWDATNNEYVGSNMYMSNAPLADAPNPESASESTSFNPTITTLADVDPGKIKQTTSEAQEAPAAEVFVERAAVKVTVTFDSSATKIGTDGAEFKDPKWFINNTAPSYYNVRNVVERNATGDWWKYWSEKYQTDKSKYFYRFVSAKKVDDSKDLYRTYWAVDPTYNYSVNTAESGTLNRTTTAPEHWLGSDKSAFCTENTMNIHGMTKDKTTCISIALKFNNGNGFWTSADKPDVILNSDGVKDKVWEYAKNNHAADYTAFVALFDNEAKAKEDLSTTYLAQSPYTTAGEIREIAETDNFLTSTSKSTDDAAKKFLADLREAFNALKFKYYEGGMAYYLLPIRHFGDVETPLAQNTNGAYYALYGDGTNAEDKNYLGRYGVVRNNWYNITIEGVLRMGSPTTFEGGEETPPQDPDDDVYSYLSAKIHILKWAKRAYGVKI